MLALSAQRLSAVSARLDVRPARFLLVGSVGVVVGFVVVWVTVRLAGLSPTVGGICATVIATFTNFLLNDRFTWGDRHVPSWRVKASRLLRYYATTAGGNVVIVVVLTLLTQRLKLHYALAYLVAVGVGGMFNYFLHNHWTWGRSRLQ